MPSRYEPCGLGQMIALRYGTIPVVRQTGGLADTVVGATEQTLREGTATGFMFSALTPTALLEALQQALDLFSQKKSWRQMQMQGMSLDNGWDESAQTYIDLYDEVCG